MFRLTDRIAALGGVLYVVFAVIGFGIVSSFMGDFEASPSDLVARFEAHRPTGSYWAGLGLEFLGLAMLILFGIRLAHSLRQRDSWLPFAAGGFLVLSASVKVGSIAAALAAYLHPARLGPQVVAGLIETDDVADGLTMGALGVFMLLIGWTMLSAATAPRWLGWSALVAGIGTMASGAGFDPGQFLGLAWFIATGVWLLRRRTTTTVPAPSAPLAVEQV